MTLTATVAGAASDTYATLAEYEARAAAMGWTLSDTDATNEAHLRRAAVALDNSQWAGVRQYSTQARDWPRVNMPLVDGWEVPVDSVPQAVKDAQCEMAYLILGGADPMATLDGVVASVRSKVGPIEKETAYQGGKATPRYLAVERLIAPYVTGGAGSLRLVRA